VRCTDGCTCEEIAMQLRERLSSDELRELVRYLMD
jgi:hypothetical protein